MAIDENFLSDILKGEIEKISKNDVFDAISKFLVHPRREMRAWDYGLQELSYPCWIVLEHADSNRCIAYCDEGFGPSHAWGLLFVSGSHYGMGMDSAWFNSLEEAFLDLIA